MAMFETYVVSEIVKEYSNAGLDAGGRLAYYRDGNSKEIDLLIMENGTLHPVEVKKNADPGKAALRNFSVLQSLSETIGEGAVVCLSSQKYPLDAKNSVVPVGMV